MVKTKLKKEITLDLDHYSPKKDEISLLLYIEKNSSRLRKKYLKYVHNLGNKKINGSNLVNLLKFDNETSFWWMSLFAEKSFVIDLPQAKYSLFWFFFCTQARESSDGSL